MPPIPAPHSLARLRAVVAASCVVTARWKPTSDPHHAGSGYCQGRPRVNARTARHGLKPQFHMFLNGMSSNVLGVSEQSPNPETTGANGVGLATVTSDGTVLDTWFPQPKLTEATGASGTERLTPKKAAETLGKAATALLGP